MSEHLSRTQPNDTDPPVLSGVFHVFLIVVLLAVVSIRSLTDIGEYDIWAHLRTGDWIVEHGEIPTYDPFTIGGDDKNHVAYYWLFSVAASTMYDQLGFPGIGLLRLTLQWAIALALLRLLHHQSGNLIVAVGLSVVAAFALIEVTLVTRTWLVTIWLFTWLLDVLLRAREHRSVLKIAWLPLLFAVWANVHVQLVYGLWMLGLFAIEPVLVSLCDRAKNLKSSVHESVPRLVLLTTCVVATVANPYGIDLHRTILQYATDSANVDIITEFQAPEFRAGSQWVMLGLICAGWFFLGWRRIASPFTVCLFASACYFGMKSVRDIWMPTVVAVSILAETFRHQVFLPATRVREYWHRIVVTTFALFIIFAFVILGQGANYQKHVAQRFPVHAAAFIEKNNLDGKLLAEYSWGGYLLWRLSDHPIFIDGRAHVHGLDTVAAHERTWFAKPGWDANPDFERAELILGSKSLPLIGILRERSDFCCIYEDDLAVLFEREKIGLCSTLTDKKESKQ